MDPKSKKPETVTEANLAMKPRDKRPEEAASETTVPSRMGAAADALLDDAAGAPKSETREALERAFRDRPDET